MWTDNETDKDFLNFACTADTVAKLIIEAKNEPVSIGVSGQWGVGKSSMIKLIRKSLNPEKNKQFVFVEFNAWLYQGYDDARAALMEVIANKLTDEAEKRNQGIEKAKDFLKRVNWLRVLKAGVGIATPLAFGLPPLGIISEILSISKKIQSGELSQNTLEASEKTAQETFEKFSGFLKPKEEKTPPKEIQAIRNSFEETLNEIGITLVVLIDDLDRCLPETTVSTLEAIRLFLFLKNTAFVIAADDEMIKHAVKKHFELDDKKDLVINYFDKLIQIPLRVPALGTQEVRAYLILLFVEASGLEDAQREEIRGQIIKQLSLSWQGKRVDRAFINGLGITLPRSLLQKVETAELLANIMTTSTKIKGNPRLIKRFLNTLYIRMAISESLGVNVDESVLVKLLLFERCGNPSAYSELLSKVNENVEGKPSFLKQWEEDISKGKKIELTENWKDDEHFVKEWLELSPTLSDRDLRGALYVSREHTPLITPEDRLSSSAIELLEVFINTPDVASSFADKLKAIPKSELSIIMDRVLDKAKQEKEWGTPKILGSLITISKIDSMQAQRLTTFLSNLTPSQIRPAIIPRISNEIWAKPVMEHWLEVDTSQQVKKAINIKTRKK
ncbi:KAP family P-loop NTPase fold protein [Sunxiuqinia dokdonensis]|uniref:KAP P-loop domain-containing protein n=1 Tax=Sunxiuqinia dokdonensis TaxID=1409788 RepID=A0A0L8VE18_9BACT|nr:P-loop NTPase fold protein [Sunxiuqinia dokdonensis]KOH46710.1 KAP P-loop domain-containing protein [Sunxiuqinia dokdonensis]